LSKDMILKKKALSLGSVAGRRSTVFDDGTRNMDCSGSLALPSIQCSYRMLTAKKLAQAMSRSDENLPKSLKLAMDIDYVVTRTGPTLLL
jgi:hypothetical protein